MRRLKNKTYKLKNFFSEGIWQLEMEELSRAKARFVKYIKVLIITIKTYSQQKIGPQAVALSFFSVMAVVPFMAIVFAITGGLGLSGRLKEMVYANFSEGIAQQAIETVMSFAQNIITTAQSGWIGMLNALLFLWIIYRLMTGVETAFNNVWMVHKSRSIVRRVSNYIIILLFSPFVILVLFSGSFVYSNLLDYVGLSVEEFGFIKKVLGWVIFAFLVMLIFSLMYKFIPKYNVRYGMALRAAGFSAIVFTGMQFLYLETQLLVSRLNGFYGTFAAVPLFMIWLNISWNIILMGAELSYAFQHVDTYNLDD
jgi:membrane protein